MQIPRNTVNRLLPAAALLSVSVLIGMEAAVAAAQTAPNAESAATPKQLYPVKLWVAGKTLPLAVSPQTDLSETYIPLAALSSVGASYRLNPSGERLRIISISGREQDAPLVRINGKAMVALSLVANAVDASIGTSAQEQPTHATFRSPNTVYLLAHVKDVRMVSGLLRVQTSFPVPFSTRMLTEARPLRGYIDCIGAELPDGLQAAPLPADERSIVRLRLGQNSPTVARVVAELADGVAMRTGDSQLRQREYLVNTFAAPRAVAAVTPALEPAPGRAARPAGSPPVPSPIDGAARQASEQPGRNPASSETVTNSGASTTTAVGDNSVMPPAPAQSATLPPAKPAAAELRGLEIMTGDPSVVRLNLTVAGRAKSVVRYSPGTTQMQVDLAGVVVRLEDGQDLDRSLSHPLIGGVHIETIQGTGAPTTRLTLDTARVLGYSVTSTPTGLSLDLRIPRNATGVLADKLIVVDAGHGGSASGATCAGVQEKNCTLSIALRLRAELESCGARVIMTRTGDMDVSLTDRSRIGNEIGADLFISIHNDSNERNNTASGTSTYYHNSDPSSRALAACVQHAVMAVTGLPSRGILSDTVMYNSGFAVLRGSYMPAVLCEVAYINHVRDRSKLIDPQFQQTVAHAMCDGLRNYVEGTSRRSSTATVKPMPPDVPGADTSGM